MPQMVEMCCGECGIEFAVPDHFYKERRDSVPSKGWYCPNGHCRVFRDNDATIARRERDRAIQEKARLADELAAATRKLAKLTKRTAAGMCPCCNRSFVNMARHMKTKHPDYAKPKAVA